MAFTPSQGSEQRTIARDLTVRLALTIAFVVVIVGGFIYALSVQKIEQELENRATDIVEKMATMLALPLWNIDEAKIQQIAHVYMDMDNVVAVRILNDDQHIMFDEQTTKDEDLIAHQRSIDYEGNLVGTVDVALTRRSIAMIKQRILLNAFIIMFFVILAVIIAIRVLLLKCLSDPLEKLTDGIGVIAGGRYNQRLGRVDEKEVNDIIDAVNVMAEAIQSREARLQKAKHELEERVETRTAQLSTANTQLRESEVTLRSIAENSLDHIMLVDLEGRVQFINRTLSGMTFEQVIGTRCIDDVPEAFRARIEQCFAQVSKTGQPGRYETEYCDKDGKVSVFEARVSPVVQDATVVALTVTSTNITERRNTENVLKQAKEAAEAAARARSQFLANMSHEIRTPMNGVIGMTSLLLGTALTDEQREYVSVVRSSSDALLTIINDILDFSKIEAGRIDLEEHTFDLHTCITESIDLLANEAAKKGFRIMCDFHPGVPAQVVSDSTRLRQIMVNLLSNAVKFTVEGEVVVSVEARPKDAEVYELQVAVRDTGIGIAPEQARQLFQPFVQGDASITRRYGGTGLGLSISRKLCQLLGGDIGVKSDPGVGSTFFFTILARRAEEERPTAYDEGQALQEGASAVRRSPKVQDAASLHILLAEDNIINQKVVLRMLERLGCQADVVADGQEAVEAVYRQRYDVVLMDVQMPQMDGLEATRCIRRELPDVRQPHVIALTANAMKGDRERCLAAGMDDYLSKPLKLGALREALAHYVEPSLPTAPDAGPITPSRPSRAAPRHPHSAP